jgi:hypothetical protein
VHDSPDDDGNIMNHDKTGPNLTKTQCDHLDP